MVREAAPTITAPIVLFTYYNPIMARGLTKFCQQIKAAGASGAPRRPAGPGRLPRMRLPCRHPGPPLTDPP